MDLQPIILTIVTGLAGAVAELFRRLVSLQRAESLCQQKLTNIRVRLEVAEQERVRAHVENQQRLAELAGLLRGTAPAGPAAC